MKAAKLLLAGYFDELAVRILSEALLCVLVAALVSALGWWREIGFNPPRNWRGLAAFAPWLLLPLLVVASQGVHLADRGRMLVFGGYMLMVGFAEEVLMRGVILKVLQPGGVMRAVLVSSLLFGLVHLANLLAGHALEPTLIQVVYAAFIGIGMAGPRLYAGTIVPAIFCHALIDFSDGVARGFVLTAPKALTLHDAAGAIIITALYAAYGWWLTRRARAAGVA